MTDEFVWEMKYILNALNDTKVHESHAQCMRVGIYGSGEAYTYYGEPSTLRAELPSVCTSI